MNRSNLRSIKKYILVVTLSLVLALFLAACGGSEPDLPPEIENISLPTPTKRPTTTPVPTASPFPTSTPIPANNESGEAEAGTGNETIIGGQTTEPAEELPEEFVEPEFVSINFRQQTINDWVEVVPPPGWIVSAGLDGLMMSQDPARVPDVPFALVRRWGNVVSVNDWVAYLPDAAEERNSNVTIRMGGYDWEGVFLTTADNSYRAFFAVSNDTLPTYTIMVFVPLDPNTQPEGGFTREALLEKWDSSASELNTILRRFLFS
ncbi:MAG: hypothetical protein AB8G95_03835 [Anaerolineae bacterium]